MEWSDSHFPLSGTWFSPSVVPETLKTIVRSRVELSLAFLFKNPFYSHHFYFACCLNAFGVSALTAPLDGLRVFSPSPGWSGSGVGDAALDLVHPHLRAGRVRGAEVVDSLAGLQLEERQWSR